MGLKSPEIFEYGSLVKGGLLVKVVLTSGVFVGKRGSQTPRHSVTSQVSQESSSSKEVSSRCSLCDMGGSNVNEPNND